MPRRLDDTLSIGDLVSNEVMRRWERRDTARRRYRAAAASSDVCAAGSTHCEVPRSIVRAYNRVRDINLGYAQEEMYSDEEHDDSDGSGIMTPTGRHFNQAVPFGALAGRWADMRAVDEQEEERASFGQFHTGNEMKTALGTNKAKYNATRRKTLDGKSHNHPFLRESSYRAIYEKLDAPHEFGGVFDYDPKTNEFYVTDDQNVGKKASVDVPLGLLEWHSHPGVCRFKSQCALGPPSAQDLINISDRHHEANRTHFVMSHDGVWGVTVRGPKPSFAQDSRFAGRSKTFLQRKETPIYRRCMDCVNNLKFLQDKFSRTHGMSYDDFLDEWIKIANAPDSPFIVDFFPLGVGPYARFFHQDAPI